METAFGVACGLVFTVLLVKLSHRRYKRRMHRAALLRTLVGA